MVFDLTSTRLVLAGNAYGEWQRRAARIGMENVTSVVLARWHAGWARTLIEVCLAPAQFSCWADLNRHRIEGGGRGRPADLDTGAGGGRCGAGRQSADPHRGRRTATTRSAWPRRRIGRGRRRGTSMPIAGTVFWSVRPRHAPPVPGVPNISVQAGAQTAADALNDAELARLAGPPPPGPSATGVSA